MFYGKSIPLLSRRLPLLALYQVSIVTIPVSDNILTAFWASKLNGSRSICYPLKLDHTYLYDWFNDRQIDVIINCRISLLLLLLMCGEAILDFVLRVGKFLPVLSKQKVWFVWEFQLKCPYFENFDIRVKIECSISTTTQHNTITVTVWTVELRCELNEQNQTWVQQ